MIPTNRGLIYYLRPIRDETTLPSPTYVSHSADEVKRLTDVVHVLE
jgi:ABC-type molybdate transport system ATPase subunit